MAHVPEQPEASVPPVRKSGGELHWIMLIGSAVVLLIAGMLSVAGESRVDLPFWGGTLPTLCHLKRFTGMDCPGCGLTRCFISLAHGDMRSAWHYNPAGLLLFALVALQVPYRGFQLWRLRQGLPEWRHRTLTNVLTVVIVSTLLLQWAGKLVGMVLAWNA